jgi:hypothetical protein
MLKFPEQWGSQSRPADPEIHTRKRRVKRPKHKTEVDNTNVDDTDMETDHNNDMCGPLAKRQRTIVEDTDTRVNTVDLHDHPPADPLDLTALGSGHKSVPKTPLDTHSRMFIEPLQSKDTYASQAPIILNIQTLVSRLPYQQMLNQVFTEDTHSGNCIPVVTRAYEESFMREPMHDYERKCVCGDNCEFNFIDTKMPFVGVEFTLNVDIVANDETRQMCVLCSRRTTQEMFYNMVYNGHRFRGFIQRYGNLCQQPGEYAREAMLVCPQNGPVQNMPLPIVAHNRHRYSVYSQNGTRYLHQHNVYYEDFHKPSSSKVPLQH